MNKSLGIFILYLFIGSCTSDLDFDQVNDLKSKPVFVTNIANFDIEAREFFIAGVEQPVLSDAKDFDVFSVANFNKYLLRADIFFEFTNTIDRAFTINLYLLDKDNNTIHTIIFNIPAQKVFPRTEIFEKTDLNILKQTTKFAFDVALVPGPPLTSNSTGNLKLRSSGTLYLELQ